MALYFVTGNKGKFFEARALLSDLEQLDIDLPEIQEIDPQRIIRAKLLEARKIYQDDLIVDDSSLYFDALNGLPGPLIKWFCKTMQAQGLYEMLDRLGNFQAEAKTIIGYAHGRNIDFFEASLKGRIVSPRGDNGFGWDVIFQPNGFKKTLAEMSLEEKNKISMRKNALMSLKEFISA